MVNLPALLRPTDEGIKILQNFGNYLPSDTALQALNLLQYHCENLKLCPANVLHFTLLSADTFTARSPSLCVTTIQDINSSCE